MQNKVKRFYTKDVRRKLLLIQLLLLFFPSIQFFSIQTDNGTIPASACYFFSLIFVPYLLMNIKQMRLPPWYIIGLYGWVFFVATLRIPQYGLSKSILHWLFGFYLLVIICNVGKELTRDEWMKILETAFCIFAIVHFLFTITYNRKVVCELLNGYFHGTITGTSGCHLRSLTRGGRNLDATWLGLGAFFVQRRKKAIYVTWAILFALLGGSRVGFIAIGIAILWSLVYDKTYRLRLNNLKWYCLYAAVMVMVIFGTGMAQGFLARTFLHVPAPKAIINSVCDGLFAQSSDYDTPSEENSDIVSASDIDDSTNRIYVKEVNDDTVVSFLSGRAPMWARAPEMFRTNPWGYGVGNTMRVMRSDFGFAGTEDVIHNVFMQWLLDEGIIGGIWYLALITAFLIRQWKLRPAFFGDPFAGYFLAYIILSLAQFHGAEALMIYVLAIALIQWKAKHICFEKQLA